MNSTSKKIDKFINSFDSHTIQSLNEISKIEVFKKNEFLLRQDQTCKKSYHIENGVARKFYISDGKEMTTELFFANDIAISFNSYAQQIPSAEFIQALSDITAKSMDYQAFNLLKKSNYKIAELDLMLTEHYAIWLEERLFQFHTMTATQRYERILANDNHIIQNIPLTIIASYLGISLETLSRIRAKI